MITIELIENFRKTVIPCVSNLLFNVNYEGMGQQDKDEFERDFNEILDLAQVALDLERRTDAVKALPSAQPEIVRCKDCIYYNSDCVDAPYGLTHAIYWCDLHYDAVYDNLAVNPDDFCSRAERRTDE